MKRFLATLALVLMVSAGISAPVLAQATEPVLSVNLVTTEIRPGVKLCEEFGSGLKIAYEPEPILTLADVDRVDVGAVPGAGSFAVELVLSDSGRARLHRFSAGNVGRRIAIVVDGVAYSIPLIRAALDLKRLPVAYYGDEALARRVWSRLDRALDNP